MLEIIHKTSSPVLSMIVSMAPNSPFLFSVFKLSAFKNYLKLEIYTGSTFSLRKN